MPCRATKLAKFGGSTDHSTLERLAETEVDYKDWQRLKYTIKTGRDNIQLYRLAETTLYKTEWQKPESMGQTDRDHSMQNRLAKRTLDKLADNE